MSYSKDNLPMRDYHNPREGRAYIASGEIGSSDIAVIRKGEEIAGVWSEVPRYGVNLRELRQRPEFTDGFVLVVDTQGTAALLRVQGENEWHISTYNQDGKPAGEFTTPDLLLQNQSLFPKPKRSPTRSMREIPLGEIALILVSDGNMMPRDMLDIIHQEPQHERIANVLRRFTITFTSLPGQFGGKGR